MMKAVVTAVFLLALSFQGVAQNELRNIPWVNHMLHIDSLNELSISPNSMIGSVCGIATPYINDCEGNLVLYYDFVNKAIRNGNHQIIQFGDTFPEQLSNANLSGVFLRKPGSSHLYYFIYRHTFSNTQPSLYSAVIDMAASNGSGRVLSRNSVVDSFVQFLSNEVTKDSIGRNSIIFYFKIADSSNVYRSLSSIFLTDTSLSAPIHSTITYYWNVSRPSLSPNSKLLAVLSHPNNATFPTLHLLNHQNGRLSPLTNIDFTHLVPQLSIGSLHVNAVEPIRFSPNSRYLYLTLRGITNWGVRSNRILRFDLSQPDSIAILGSAFIDPNPYNFSYLNFPIANDKSIWTLMQDLNNPPNSFYFSRINQPDSSSFRLRDSILHVPVNYACNIPLFPSYLYNPNRYSIVSDQYCLGDSTRFRLYEYDNLNTVYWHFGDTSNAAFVDSSEAPKYLFPGPGTYHVTAYVQYCHKHDTLRTEVTILAPPASPALPDTALCVGSDLPLALPAQAGNSVLWSSGDSSWSTSFSSEGWQWVEISNACFSTRDSFYVTVHEAPQSGLPADTNLCVGDVLLLTPAAGDYSWAWQDGSTVPLSVTESGTYALLMTNACGTFVHEVQVQFRAAPVLALNDTSRCEGQFYRIELPDTWQGAYQWNDGSSERIRILTDSGWYSAQITNPCGTASDAFYLSLVDCACHMYLPTAFTPNGDGLNDELVVITRCPLSDFQLEVYNRWGQQIFVSNDISRGWDGTYQGELLPPGSYPFLIRYVPEGRNARVEKGVVHLLR